MVECIKPKLNTIGKPPCTPTKTVCTLNTALRDKNTSTLMILRRQNSTFYGKELFPSKEEKAARLWIGLISGHAFVDENKGVFVMLTFLKVNGIRLRANDGELVEIGLAITESKMKYEELLQRILKHKI